MPSRNISQQKLTIGLDLGDRNSWYCVLDEAGQIQREQRVRTNAKALREVFGALPRSRIALEIGTHSPWISPLLSELGHEVIVANARKVPALLRNSGLLVPHRRYMIPEKAPCHNAHASEITNDVASFRGVSRQKA
ncbi:MAG: hypothetical protein DMG78_20095 [Acidobacteria bacterium]|nr:MAG: hypothetical protein DMG78_20095 [Acidobacteriota bacterium]